MGAFLERKLDEKKEHHFDQMGMLKCSPHQGMTSRRGSSRHISFLSALSVFPVSLKDDGSFSSTGNGVLVRLCNWLPDGDVPSSYRRISVKIVESVEAIRKQVQRCSWWSL